ncbi:MAG TPA: CHAT domain-containing protein [Polyangia bacterium]
MRTRVLVGVVVLAAVTATLGSCGPAGRGSGSPAALRGLEVGSRALAAARFKEAERAFRDALVTYRKRGDAGATAAALTWLARTARAQGRPVLAVALAKEALALQGQIDDKGGAADAHEELALACLEAGDFDDAREEFLWAVANARAAHDAARESMARAGLARLAVVHGDFDEAAAELGRAEKLVAGLTGAAAGRLATELGGLYGSLHDLGRALPQLERAAREHLRANDRRRAAIALVALGRLALVARRTIDGTAALSQAVEVALGLGSAQVAAAIAHQAGDVLARAGDAAGARSFYATASKLYVEAGDREGGAHLEVSAALLDLAAGQIAAAVPRLERAALVLELLGDRYGAGETRVLLARSRLTLKDSAGGAGELQRALDHAAELNAPELAWRAYTLLGYLTETLLDREAEAGRFYDGAVQAIETTRAGIDHLVRDGSLAATIAGTAEDAYYRMARLKVKEARRSGDARRLDLALTTVEKARSRATFDLLARAGATLADTPAQQRRARALAGEENEIALMLVRPGLTADTRRSLRVKLERIRAARAAEEQQAMRFAAAQPEPVTAAVLRRTLGADEAVLSYFLGPEGSLLMVFTREKVAAFDLPGREALGRLTVDWRAALRGGDAASVKTATAALTQAALGPAQQALAGKKRLLVVPHGPLWLVAFAALGDGTGYLGARMVITYSASLSSWLRARETPHGAGATRELLAVAGARPRPSPVADTLTIRGYSLATPPRSAREVWVAAGAFGAQRSTVLAGGAGEAGLRAADLASFRRIHLAAPAIYTADLSGLMQPAIALGGAGKPDGLLQLREILALPLPASVVAVGALEAPADLRDGASVQALGQAFQLAGAGAVILPLWEPDEAPAAAFWTAFYDALRRGVPAADALAEAQRRVAARFPSPHAFAPFVLVGSEGVKAQ